MAVPTSPEGRVRWGIIGCGDVTEVKSGPAFARISGSSLAAVMRRDAAKARAYAERHGVPRWTTDAAEIIDAEDVDAVYVATPPASHAHYVRLAAAAGKPVYVEKPMALDGAAARAMVEGCAAAGVPLFVAYYRRALPRFEFVRARLEGGSIGEPTLVQLELHLPAPAEAADGGWRWDPAVGGDGLLLDVGSHGLDLVDHWFGPIAAVEGFAATRLPWSRVPDEVVGSFRFASGPLGVGTWGFAGTARRDALTIVGTRGSISVPLLAEGPVRLTDAAGAVVEHVVPHPAHVQEPLITTVVDELLARGGRCPSTGVSGLRTQRVLDALLEAWRAERVAADAPSSR
jgi:1,5-anhydro-D-fructose reductase (1,5-anhydro-D-mannitol-forming)